MNNNFPKILHLIALFLAFNLANCEPFIGVNYGQVADNLPPPSVTAKLLQSTSIGKVRLYGSDPAIIKALANTGIGIVIGAANGDIPSLAGDPNFAKNWVSTNVIPYYPASNIILITVGNEIITSNDQNLMNQMLPAIQNVQNALDAASLGGKIKVSTVHSMAVLRDSEPPSAGRFHPEYDTVLQGLLSFNNATGSPFAINPYPYFAYRDDPGRADNLAFCLFQPNAGRIDPNTNIKYMNMFDAQVDAVRSALDSLGFKNVEIVVAETGWPYKGDNNEVGPSLENAKAYNGNLIAHLRSMVGTPLMPGKSVDTYIFALYDEDLKPGPASERAFGLFNPDQTMIYDAGLSKQQSNTTSPVAAPAAPTAPTTTPDMSKSPLTPTPRSPTVPTLTPNKSASWCMPKAGVTDVQLQANLDYACGQGIDCSPIQQGGACFEPNTLVNHAAFAMNLLYQTSGRNPLTCDFSKTAILSTNNPRNNRRRKGMATSRDLELLIPVSSLNENGASKSFSTNSSPGAISNQHHHHHSGHEAFLKVIRSWASKKFMTGCVILFPIAITFYVTWGFIRFVDGFFSPIYTHLGINIFGMGFVTSITFIFLIGIFMSSWLGTSVLTLGEWFIKKMPLVSYIYAASKQISTAISPEQSSNAFKEVALIRHPRVGEYAVGFITSSVKLHNNRGIDEELLCVYIPTNHLYLGDIILISSHDILRPNLSVREGIEIVISGGMSIPQLLTTVDVEAKPTRMPTFSSTQV